MANTVIQLKNSGVSGNVPVGLQPGELAINHADGRLYYGNEAGGVVLFDVITEPSGLDGELQFNDAGSFGADANLSFDKDTGTLTTQNIQVGNKLSVSENVYSGNLVVNTAIFTALALTQSTPLPNAVAVLSGNTNQYVQMSLQNIDEHGSADYIVTADVGTDTDFYIDVGLLNSQYVPGAYNNLGTASNPLDGYLIVQGSTIGQPGGNLIIGTTSGTPGQKIRFVAGGSNTEDVVATFGSDGVEIVPELVSPTTTRISGHANSAYDQANTGTQYGTSAGSYANSAYAASNTADQRAVTSGVYANAAYSKANSSSTLAQSAYDKANTSTTNCFSTIIVDGYSNIVATSPTTNLTFLGQTGIAIGTDSANSIIAIGTNLVGASNVIVDYGTVTQLGVITFDYGYLV